MVRKAPPIQDIPERTTSLEELALSALDQQEALNEAHDAQDRLRFLLEASTLLATSLDYEKALKRLAGLATLRLADLCLIDVDDGQGVRRVAAVHRDATRQQLADQLERFAPRANGPHPAVRVMRTGVPERSKEMTPEFLRATTVNEEHFRLTQELGFLSFMCVPLVARDRVLGTITFLATRDSGRRFDEGDLALARDLAYRAALMVDNARLYEQRDHAARVLQESLLPPALPTIPQLELAASYRPAREEIGGDFYDVFATGRRTWAAVMGDVCGKGVEAARLTALARYTIRAAAMPATNPAAALRLLNEALLRESVERADDWRFCSAAFVQLRLRERGVAATVALGGHPRPWVLRGDGTVRPIGAPGTLIGLFEDPFAVNETVHLDPGDGLVLFTDGVTDANAPRGILGDEALAEVLRDVARAPAGEVVLALERSSIDAGGRGVRDDVAILALRVTAPD
jgi:serine phosphatase RsbU (regulator of sigma subunit)